MGIFYINASIIVQLLGVVIPKFENGLKGVGRTKTTADCRYGAIVLTLLQATGMTLGIFRQAVWSQYLHLLLLCVVAGTAFLSG